MNSNSELYLVSQAMKNLLISQDVFPIGEFKKQASRLFRKVNEDKRAIVVTQNGAPVGVVIPPEEFDRINELERFVSAVEKGLSDSETGRVLSEKEAKAKLEKRFGKF